MTNWESKVKVKHLLTDREDHRSVQASMNAIADVLEKLPEWYGFRRTLKKFHAIPKGDDVFGPAAYSNKLLDKMYDYANECRIWVE